MAYVSIPTYWKALPQRYCLIGLRCKSCGTINFPARDICLGCGKKAEYEQIQLKRQGKIYSYTIIFAGAASEFTEQQRLTGSFGIAIVELEEGPRIIAQMTDCKSSELTIGMKIEGVFRRIYTDDENVIRYGIKFRPRRV